ncbi:MAG TPA: hypothetical protein VIY90_13575 [Steroidobacteraceae bacterium]
MILFRMCIQRPQFQRLVLCLALNAAWLSPAAHATAPTDCTRACLGNLVAQYMKGMIAHDAGSLPVTPHARFTQNGEVMKLGAGLWLTASGIGPYEQEILDVPGHTAAAQAIVLEAGNKPVLFAVRLKERGGRINEIETMVVRSDKDSVLFDPAGFDQGNAQMAYVPPSSDINSRAAAIRIAMKYPEGLRVGSFVQVDAPFATDAYRIENGVHTAGAGCTRAGCEHIKTQTIIPHPDVRARVAAVDDRLGIVLLYLDFGNTKTYGAGRALVTFEAFKVYGGQIHAVNAILHMASATAGSGWDAHGQIESGIQ